MCGLLYAKRRDNRSVVKSLLKRFEHQKGRGTQGFGYIVIKNGIVVDTKRTKYEYHIKEFLNKEDGASEILFHHRFPTSTENLAEVTHPIVVNNSLLDHNYYVIHNGVLTNEDELKDEYVKMGFSYTTDIVKKTTTTIAGVLTSEEETVGYNDSESFAIDLALYLDGKKSTIDSMGSTAFICLQTDKEDRVEKIHYGRNDGNPLVVEDNNDLFVIKSTGSGKDIAEDTLYSIDYRSGETIETKVKVGKRWVTGFSNGYQHHAGCMCAKCVNGDKDKQTTLVLPDRSHITFSRGGRYTESYDSSFDDTGYGGYGGCIVRSLEGDTIETNTPTRVSLERLSEVKEEIEALEADIDFAIEELKRSGVTSQEAVYYGQTIKETRAKLDPLEQEESFLEDFFEK